MAVMVLETKTLPESSILGIASDCGFTVDDFMARKCKEKVLEGEIISLTPLREVSKNEYPLLGLTIGSRLTVDEFLIMTKKDKILEGLES